MSSLTREMKGEVLVVKFADNKILDEAKIQQIGKELIEIAGVLPNGKLLLNFENVSFMSSAMIGKIIQLKKKCGDDIKLKLCAISDNVMEVFKLMRLHKALELYKDEAKALASFEKKGWFG